MIIVEERFGSRGGNGGNVEFLYLARTTAGEEETEVRSEILDASPSSYDNKPQIGITDFKQEGNDLYFCTVEYGDGQNVIDSKTPDSTQSFEFNTTGSTLHITQSIKTRWAYANGIQIEDPGTVSGGIGMPFFHGAIGVSEDGDVQGVDIPAGLDFEFSVTREMPIAAIDEEYIDTIYLLTNHYNESATSIRMMNGIILTFPTGELLFKGAIGSGEQGKKVKITFNFAASKNISADESGAGGLVIGDIDIDEKLGVDYLWVYYEKRVTDGSGTDKFVGPKPIAAFVEQVYHAGDLTLLLGAS